MSKTEGNNYSLNQLLLLSLSWINADVNHAYDMNFGK